MKWHRQFLAIVPAILLLSGCIIIPFPHTDLDTPRYSGRVLDASTRHPIGGAKVVVAGLPRTSVETDSSGHFLTRFGVAWMLVSEGTPSGDMGIPLGSYSQGYLLVTHPGYRQGKVKAEEAEPYPVFLGGLDDVKPDPVGDILLRRQR
jgi:hypothetical protein